MFRYYKWEEVDINWENLDMNWEEVGIVVDELLSRFGGGGIPTTKPLSDNDFFRLKEINDLPEEKKRIIIKLVCKITGDDREYIGYKYKNQNIAITVDHINIIINEVKNKIKVNVQNIS